jgi:SAM-dependent methyltransferase
MITTLKNWIEIGEANKSLARAGLPRHATPEKNWDLFLLRGAVAEIPRGSRIVDLGCGDCFGLKYLAALGFTNLLGIDLSISWRARASALKRRLTGRPRFSLRRGNMIATGLPSRSVDFALSVSTIEHGVPLDAFLMEAARILRPGAGLFITTDYWSDPIDAPGGDIAFGLPWRPFDRQSALDFIHAAERCGLTRASTATDLSTVDRCVVWAGREYTFVAMLFTKVGDTAIADAHAGA